MTEARTKRWLLLGGAMVTVASLAGAALGEYLPVLHERFEPDPREDVAFGVRVTTSGLPAALMTPAGAMALPEPTALPRPGEPAYGEAEGQGRSTLRMDGTTYDPGELSYHEPFRPSVAPFKRTHVYDAVDEQFDLVVADTRLRPANISPVPLPSQDQFFADLVVSAQGERPVRIASPGPKMSVYGAHLEPEAPFGFYVDGADNWFVRMPSTRGKARLVMHVGVEHASFSGRIEAVSYSALAAELRQIPANVRLATSEVLTELRVSRVLSPADALERLVTYFRGFSASKEVLATPEGEALYRELVRSRKGVCRHRAYAFVVTALGFGIPARFVHNEAHAWVEVFGGTLWHRIDLGGASSGFEYRGERPVGPPHVSPGNDYPWPKHSQSAVESLPAAEAPASSSTTSTSSKATEPTVTVQEPAAKRSTESRRTEERDSDSDPAGRIEVSLSGQGKVRRGESLEVTGKIVSTGASCAGVRVELTLLRGAQLAATGSAMTNEQGQFVGRLVVPADLAVGAYELSAISEETKSCPRAALP